MRGLFIAGGVALAVLISTFGGCVGQLDQGQEGVKTSMGVVTEQSMSPGPYLAMPWQGVYEYDNRVQTITDQTEVFTKDTQPADMSYTVKFQLQRGHAGAIYQIAKSDWETKLVTDFINDALKNGTGKFEANELVQNRDNVANLVQQYLQARIDTNLQSAGVASGVIRVSAFTINDIKFAQGYTEAVAKKAEAEQNAQAEHNRTASEQEKANQVVIAAKAQAEAMQIKSAALSQNQNLVDYERVIGLNVAMKAAADKWDGSMPTNYYAGTGNAMPFIKLPDPSTK